MSNSIAPGSSADVNVRVTALTTNPNVPAQYKTIILKKNLVNGVNTLTQEMMSTTNTKYVIKYDYVLGENITVPADCILYFDGGKISNGTLIFNNTELAGIIKCDTDIEGTVKNSVLNVTWFGLPNDGTELDVPSYSPYINTFTYNEVRICKIIDVAAASYSNVYFPKGTYSWLRSTTYIDGIGSGNNPFGKRRGETIDATDTSTYHDLHNIIIYGDGINTVINGSNGDTINIHCCKNFTIKDLCITNHVRSSGQDTAGYNIVSIIDGENIELRNLKLYNAYRKYKIEEQFMDGGSGITLQGDNHFNNIKITDCHVIGCRSGFDCYFIGDTIANDPNCHVLVTNFTADRCYYGLWLLGSHTSTTFNHKGLITISNYHVSNCLKPFEISDFVGANVQMTVKNTMTVPELSYDTNGELWVPSVIDSDIQKASFLAHFYGTKGSNISIDAQIKELNNTILFDRLFYTPQGGSLTAMPSTNNKIRIAINDDAEIVVNPNHESIGDETLVERKITYPVNSNWEHNIFELDGFNDVYNNAEAIESDLPDKFNGDYTYGIDRHNIISIDGNLYANNIIGVYRGLERNASDNMIGRGSKWNIDANSTKMRLMSDNISVYDYSFIDIINTSNMLVKTSISNNGHIMAYDDFDDEAYDNNLITEGRSLKIFNGANPSNLRFIPVLDTKGNKGGTSARPDANNKLQIGRQFFDTDLNKPIWYVGVDQDHPTGWVDASGTSV